MWKAIWYLTPMGSWCAGWEPLHYPFLRLRRYLTCTLVSFTRPAEGFGKGCFFAVYSSVLSGSRTGKRPWLPPRDSTSPSCAFQEALVGREGLCLYTCGTVQCHPGVPFLFLFLSETFGQPSTLKNWVATVLFIMCFFMQVFEVCLCAKSSLGTASKQRRLFPSRVYSPAHLAFLTSVSLWLLLFRFCLFGGLYLNHGISPFPFFPLSLP